MTGQDRREMFQRLPFPFDGDEFPAALGAVIQRTVLCSSLAAVRAASDLRGTRPLRSLHAA